MISSHNDLKPYNRKSLQDVRMIIQWLAGDIKALDNNDKRQNSFEKTEVWGDK